MKKYKKQSYNFYTTEEVEVILLQVKGALAKQRKGTIVSVSEIGGSFVKIDNNKWREEV